MSKTLQSKLIGVKALDVDGHKKQVKVAISQMETVDRDNDIFDPGAWNKTIKENGPKGSNEVWHLLDHGHRTFSALGKFSELFVEGKYLVGVSTYKDSFAWREVAWPLYEAGDITQHSVGFETINVIEPKSEDKPRIITEARLYEGSAVPFGAQPDTPTMAVVKSLIGMSDMDITAADKIDEIIKKLKNQRRGFNEEDYSLLIIELKHLQKIFDSKQVTEIFREPSNENTPDTTLRLEGFTPTEPNEPTQPETVECPKCKKITKNTQMEKGYISCHRCKAVFAYGSKSWMDIFN